MNRPPLPPGWGYRRGRVRKGRALPVVGTDDQADVQARFDATLRRMLATPPKPQRSAKP